MAAVAVRLRMSGLWPQRGLAAGRWQVHVLWVRRPDIGDRRYDLRPHANPVDCLVYGLLAVRHREGWDLGAEPEEDAGDRLVPNRVGNAAPAAVGAGPPGPGCLTGVVEVDETYIGGLEPGLAGGRARGKKILTGVAVEVREPRGIDRCRMAPVADASAKSLHAFVKNHVEPGTRGITDGWQGYSGLEKLGYVHDRRSQRAARTRGEDPGELLPAVHRIASLAKRWLLGTHPSRPSAARIAGSGAGACSSSWRPTERPSPPSPRPRAEARRDAHPSAHASCKVSSPTQTGACVCRPQRSGPPSATHPRASGLNAGLRTDGRLACTCAAHCGCPRSRLKLTLPTPTAAAAVQSNKVYLTPCTTVPSFSVASASDKRYSLGRTRTRHHGSSAVLRSSCQRTHGRSAASGPLGARVRARGRRSS